MTLTQQWRYLNLTRNCFYILFPAKGIMSYRQINSIRLYVRLKGTCSLASRATPANKLNKVNVNCLNIPKKHRGLHKTSSRAVCLRPVLNVLLGVGPCLSFSRDNQRAILQTLATKIYFTFFIYFCRDIELICKQTYRISPSRRQCPWRPRQCPWRPRGSDTIVQHLIRAKTTPGCQDF